MIASTKPRVSPGVHVSATAAADRLIFRMACEIEDGAVVATGVASPLAVLAIALARVTHAPHLTDLGAIHTLDPDQLRGALVGAQA